MLLTWNIFDSKPHGDRPFLVVLLALLLLADIALRRLVPVHTAIMLFNRIHPVLRRHWAQIVLLSRFTLRRKDTDTDDSGSEGFEDSRGEIDFDDFEQFFSSTSVPVQIRCAKTTC